MIIGVQKCGTTSLAGQLEQHPAISFCQHKEPDFFSKNADWKEKLNEYHAMYDADESKLRGEASTTYSWFLEFPRTAERLYEYNPGLKLIYIVRDPVERVRSHYMHELSKARTQFPLEEEVFRKPTYISHSRYAMQIRPFLERFRKEQVHYILFEDYVKDPVTTLKGVCRFLGIDEEPVGAIDLKPRNASLDRLTERRIKKVLAPYVRFIPLKVRSLLKGPFVYEMKSKVVLPGELKKILWRHVEDDVHAMEKITGMDLSAWRRSNNTGTPNE